MPEHDDDEDEIPMSATAAVLLIAAGGFSLLVAAYLAFQAFPLASVCKAGDAVQCARYASTVRQLQVFGVAGLLFSALAFVFWRISKRKR